MPWDSSKSNGICYTRYLSYDSILLVYLAWGRANQANAYGTQVKGLLKEVRRYLIGYHLPTATATSISKYSIDTPISPSKKYVNSSHQQDSTSWHIKLSGMPETLSMKPSILHGKKLQQIFSSHLQKVLLVSAQVSIGCWWRSESTTKSY